MFEDARRRSNHTACLAQAPAWMINELRQAGYRVPDGLPNDHPAYSHEQREINRREQARLDSETAIDRVRRIAREKRRRAGR